MRELRRLWIVVPAVVLVVLGVVWYATRGASEEVRYMQRGAGVGQALVDQSPFDLAKTLATLAVSPEERGYATEAERLADHEVDQSFAMALREAATAKRVSTPEVQALEAKVAGLKATVAEDKALVAGLTAAATASGQAGAEGDSVDVAKAQLGLDTDELTDATANLARTSGDRRGEIQQELGAREAAMKKFDSGGGGETVAVTVAGRHPTLWGRISAWFGQRSRVKLLAQAEAKALGDAKEMRGEHARMEAAAGVEAGGAVGSERVRMLESKGTEHAVMSILDDRVQTEEDLARVYREWGAQVWVQHRIVGHLVVESMGWVTLIVLLAAIAAAVGKMGLRRVSKDKRKTRTLETILTLGVEVVAVLAILLVMFGPPAHTPTILGLATAGLTVVFQDFILAFFGWFVLMGKNGIRVGDWVEIDGVGGEVSEIGLFKTVLLETGNWTSQGHPTGRRVAFTNSYAIRGRFFNFSSHAQWMWDEIKVSLPGNVNAAAVVEQMRTSILAETAGDTEKAEAELRSVSGFNGLGQFGATPTVDLVPAAGGVDVIVRFVTRANERFEKRNQLFGTVVGILQAGVLKGGG